MRLTAGHSGRGQRAITSMFGLAAVSFVVAVLSVGVLPAAATPDSGAPQPETVVACYGVSGHVRDGFQSPISGAFVQVGGSHCSGTSSSGYTDANGYYGLEMPIDTNTSNCVQPCGSIAVSKPGFVDVTHTVVPDTTAKPGQNDVVMNYTLTATLSANAIQPSHVLTVSAATTAPPSASRAVVQMPSGTRQNMTQQSQSQGVTNWSWSYSVASTEGSYTIKVCAINVANTSQTCDSAGASVVSAILSATYVVDGTPPSVSATHPLPNHETATSTPTVSASISDVRSGVDTSRTVIAVDGVTVATGTSAVTLSSPLALGIHSASVTAYDLASNSSTRSWSFDVVSVVATPGSATIAPITKSYSAGASTITFSSVSVNTTPSSLAMSSAMSPGLGTTTIWIPLNSSVVTFHNTVGTSRADPVPGSRQFDQSYAVLAPESGAIRVQIDGRSINAGDITATIPATSRVPGGTATLSMSAVAVSVLTADDPAPTPMPCSTGCTGTALIDCNVASSSGAVSEGSCSTDAGQSTYPNIYLAIGGQSYPSPVMAPAVGPYGVDPDADTYGVPAVDPTNSNGSYGSMPTCQSGSCTNLLQQLGGGNYANQKAYWQVGAPLIDPATGNPRNTGLLSIFGHDYYYGWTGSLGSPVIQAWQQSNATPGSSPCVTGGSIPGVSTTTVSFGHSVVSNDLAWSATNRKTTTGYPTTGQLEDVVLTGVKSGTRIYAVGSHANLAHVWGGSSDHVPGFSGGYGQAYQQSASPDTSASLVSAARSAYSLFAPATSAAAAASQQELMSGVEFGGGTSLANFGLRTSTFVSFTYTNGGC